MYRTDNRSCVTLVGYMLGISDYVLERDYYVDYNRVQCLSFIDELNIIRSFNKVRQNIFKNYKYYKNTYLGDVSNNYVDEDLFFLRERGYDLFNVSKLDSSAEYLLNSIKKDVDCLVPIVLEKLNLQYVDELKSLFTFPIFDKKSLLNFVTGLKGRSLPHGIVIPKYKRIQTSLQYLFSSDITLYAGAFSLCEKEFSYVLNIIKPYDWSIHGLDDYVYRDEADYSNSIYDDYDDTCDDTCDDIYDNSFDENCDSKCDITYDKENNLSISTSKNDNLDTSKDEPKSTVVDVKRKIIENTINTVKTCNKYFVDCDNIDFFKFLSMLDTLEEFGIKDTTFYLYTDLKATYLWEILGDIRSNSNFNFVYKKVDRVKGNKSVVDLVIAVDICKDVMKNNNTSVGLISSDSDFYGVLASIDNIEFVVGYNSECTSSAYLHYLSKNNHKKFDVKVFEKEETLTRGLDKIVTYLVLSILSNIAMTSWDLDVLLESVRGGIEKESSFTLEDSYLRELVSNILTDLRVCIVDSALHFSYGDISIKMNK